MKLITLARFLNDDKPLDENQTMLVNRAQECLTKGYITREEATDTIIETMLPSRHYYL